MSLALYVPACQSFHNILSFLPYSVGGFFQSVHVSGPVSSLSRLFSWIQLRPAWDLSPFRFCVLLKRQTNEEFTIIRMQKNKHQKLIVSHGGRGQTAHICFQFSVSFIKRKLNDIYNDLPPRVALDFDGSFLFTHNAAVHVRCNAFSCFPPCGWIMIINGAVGGVCRVLFIKTLVIFICCPWLDPPSTPGLWWHDGFLHEIQISVGRNAWSRVMFLSNYNDVSVWPLITVQPSAYGSSDDMMLNASYSMKDTQQTENITFRVCRWQTVIMKRIHVGFMHFWWMVIQFLTEFLIE